LRHAAFAEYYQTSLIIPTQVVILLFRKGQVKPGRRFSFLGVMLGYQGFMASGGDPEMDMGQAADIVAGPIAFKGVSAPSVRNNRGPVGIIVFSLFVYQPELENRTRQGTAVCCGPYLA
jgi:hypothetical protein